MSVQVELPRSTRADAPAESGDARNADMRPVLRYCATVNCPRAPGDQTILPFPNPLSKLTTTVPSKRTGRSNVFTVAGEPKPKSTRKPLMELSAVAGAAHDAPSARASAATTRP